MPTAQQLDVGVAPAIIDLQTLENARILGKLSSEQYALEKRLAQRTATDSASGVELQRWTPRKSHHAVHPPWAAYSRKNAHKDTVSVLAETCAKHCGTPATTLLDSSSHWAAPSRQGGLLRSLVDAHSEDAQRKWPRAPPESREQLSLFEPVLRVAAEKEIRDVAPSAPEPWQPASQNEPPERSRRARIKMLEAMVGDTSRYPNMVNRARLTVDRSKREHILRSTTSIDSEKPQAAPLPIGVVGGQDASFNETLICRLPDHNPLLSDTQQLPTQQQQQKQQQQPQRQLQQKVCRPFREDASNGLGSMALLTELSESLKAHETLPDELAHLCRTVERRAYELRPHDAIRALALLERSATQVANSAREPSQQATTERQKASMSSERIVDAMRNTANRIAAAVGAQLLDMSAAFVADALSAFSITRTGRQELLDAALARLLLLIRTEAHTVTPRVIGRTVGAIGRMHVTGGVQGCSLTAREECHLYAGSNARFLVAFNSHLVRKLPDCLEDDLGEFHEAYCDAYLGEQEMGRVLDRAAHLQVGLRPESLMHLAVWQRIEASTRARLPQLMPALSDFTQQYCRELATASAEGVTLLCSSARPESRDRQKLASQARKWANEGPRVGNTASMVALR